MERTGQAHRIPPSKIFSIIQLWGDEPTRRAREEQFERERKALGKPCDAWLGHVKGMRTKPLDLAALRTAEDDSRNISAELRMINELWDFSGRRKTIFN